MRVSVVIPSYNHAAFIGEALASVLDSSMAGLEVVVVDDGSSDGSLEVLAGFEADPRVRVVAQENRGAHAALNRCLELSHGEIVFVLNSDDAFEPERIPRLVERLERSPRLAMVCTWIRVVDEAGNELGVKQGFSNMLPPWASGADPRLSGTGDLELALLESNFVSTTSNIAFRRELVTRHGLGFQPLRYTHDWDFILAACAHGALEQVDEPLVRYRVHGASTIAEGQHPEAGQGLMSFEILWVVARHALRVLRQAQARGHDLERLRRLLRASMPRLGDASLVSQLLYLRGNDDAAPAAYDDLIRPGHPFREAAIRALS